MIFLVVFPVLLLTVSISYAGQRTETIIQSKSKRIQASLQTPRQFGYSAGDLIQHQIHITIPPGTELNTNQLPSPGPALEWLDVIDVQVKTLASNQFKLNIQYQISKSARMTEWLEIPEFLLSAGTESSLDTIVIPAWKFSYSSIIPTRLIDADITIRPPRQPIALEEQAIFFRMLSFLTGMLICLGYIVWRRGYLQLPWSRHSTPFQSALKGLKQLPEQSTSPKHIQHAFRLVHTALNQTAGEIVLESHLTDFYTKQPELAKLKEETESFFKQSRYLFYESNTTVEPKTLDKNLIKTLKQLCSRYDRFQRQR